MFRVKIDNEEDRKQLLLNAKNLKNNNSFKNIYINRDLTYKQRSALYHRRRNPPNTNSNNNTQSCAKN